MAHPGLLKKTEGGLINPVSGKTLKRRIYEIIEVAHPEDKSSRLFDLLILTLVALNVVALVVETVEGIYQKAPEAFLIFDVISVIVFSIEYLLRVWSCTSSPKFPHPLWGRLRFMMTPLAIIDLLAVLPFFVSILYFDLRALRSLRLFRLLRLAKLGRYSAALRTMGRVISRKREEVLVTLSLLCMLVVIASSLMYFAETHIQPDAFPSIPATMWWSVATVTTVGYGDVYPITPIGKLLGAIVAILGIAFFALPAALLGPGFIEEMALKQKNGGFICPHCKRDTSQD